MRQVFVDRKIEKGMPVLIEGEEHHHLTRSLRAKLGESLLLVDLEAGRFHGVIESITRHNAQVRVVDVLDPEPEIPFFMLGLCAPKAEAFDAALDAANQLGVSRFVPLISIRSQKIPENRQARWQRIVRESCCQCLRAKPMQVLEPQKLEDFLSQEHAGKKIVAWQGGGAPEAIGQKEALTLLIGSEGGFDPSEISMAKDQKWGMLALGPRVLRVPVALGAALGALNAMRAQ